MTPSDKPIKLFEEFDPVSKESWKKQMLHELKAATLEEKQALYEQKMIWQPEQHIAIEPFYTREDMQTLPLPAGSAYRPGWLTQELVPFADEKSTNQVAREALQEGANALCFDLTGRAVSSVNLVVLLQGIKLSDTPVSFMLDQPPGNFIEKLRLIAPYQWKGGLNYDPFTRSGSVPEVEALAEVFSQTNGFPEFYTLSVNSHSFNKAGVSTTQEVAYLLAAFVEYVHQLTERGIRAEVIFNKTVFSVRIGTDFFMEIAKLRALRVLYSQLASAYGVQHHRLFVHTQIMFANHPGEDTYNNFIRTTIAAMAAVLGGSQALSLLPYNGKAEDVFARRMARNVSLILREESYFAQLADIPNGSYYIENLTGMLARQAWHMFREIEAQGGFLQARQSGFLSLPQKVNQ